ncbi:MAG: DUF4286 family protein [Bacteroidetes bacterium]|jgi:hypothetical protein|nr:DUF4286 family protein [Bacteroidota bacterium]TSA57784.1 MAG: DUF4286 family protein [Sediminibacterium sp.]
MYIYNITSKIDPSIHENWVAWMKETHIPEVMATNCFTQYQFVRLLEVDDSDGPTYAIQYMANSKADYNRYLEIHAPLLSKKAANAWGNLFIGFRSLMQVVH